MPGDVQVAVPGVNSTLHPAGLSVNTVGPADLARTEFNTTDTAYRQTLSAFNSFVCGITTVCLLNR